MKLNQNILAILRAYLTLQKYFMKNSTPSKLAQLLQLNLLITNRKKISNEHTLLFVRQKYL